MDNKIQQQLYDKYPDLFIEHNLDKKESCMYWGIDCSSGWFNIIDQVCQYIAMNLKHNWHCYPKLRFTQVKEKFGTLRLYYTTECMTKDEYFKKYMENYREEYLKRTVDDEQGKLDYANYLEQCRRGAECFDGAINFAEHMSGHICEECGTNHDVNIRNRGTWLKTLCMDCKEKLKYEIDTEEMINVCTGFKEGSAGDLMFGGLDDKTDI